MDEFADQVAKIAAKVQGRLIPVDARPELTTKPRWTMEQMAAFKAEKAERDKGDLEQLRQINSPENRFRNIVGKSYAKCRLSNFETVTPNGVAIPKAASVLSRMKQIAEHAAEAIKAMRQIILYGKPGCGKDHLIAGLLWEMMSAGFSIHWANGERFAALVRDQMDYHNKVPDRVWLSQWVSPDVLALSDPDGEATRIPDHVKQRLYDVIDARIREGRPTWITINGDRTEDIEARLGARIYDRCRQDAWVLHCDWDSRRLPRGVE